jgi:hypothetical protein
MSMARCDRHDEEYDTDLRCECYLCEQEQAEAYERDRKLCMDQDDDKEYRKGIR